MMLSPRRLAEDPLLLRREALTSGMDDACLRRLVRRGDLRRLRQGVYVDATTWDMADRVERHRLLCRGVRRLYGDGVALSHSSAAIAWGAPNWRLPLDSVHLLHLNGVAGRRQALVVHHRGHYNVDDLTRDAEGWITTPARTLVDTSKTVPTEVALVLADWLLHTGLATTDQLFAAMDRQEDSPHTLRLRPVIAHSEALTESVGETRTRYRLRRAGFPTPVPQYRITDEHGRFVARVDFAWPELGVVLEFDGLQKYGDLVPSGSTMLEVVRAEKRRDRELAALGWIVIRIEWADLEKPERFLDRLWRVLQRAAS